MAEVTRWFQTCSAELKGYMRSVRGHCYNKVYFYHFSYLGIVPYKVCVCVGGGLDVVLGMGVEC